MSDLLKLIIYVFQKYPLVNELSKPRLVKMIYLIDWKHAIDTGHQITHVKWYFNDYGPYVDDIFNMIKQESEYFTVDSYENPYGTITDKITLGKSPKIELTESARSAADYIINHTYKLKWSEFISLVYSTYPIKTNSRYTYFNLEEKAISFKKYREAHSA